VEIAYVIDCMPAARRSLPNDDTVDITIDDGDVERFGVPQLQPEKRYRCPRESG
jgi:hypothetical protein